MIGGMIRPIIQAIGDYISILERPITFFDEKYEAFKSGDYDEMDHYDDEWLKQDSYDTDVWYDVGYPALVESLTCIWNAVDPDMILMLPIVGNFEEEEKQNVRTWIDEVETYIEDQFAEISISCSVGDELPNSGRIILLLRFCYLDKLITKMARCKTTEEWFGGRIAPQPWLYVRESVDPLSYELEMVKELLEDGEVADEDMAATYIAEHPEQFPRLTKVIEKNWDNALRLMKPIFDEYYDEYRTEDEEYGLNESKCLNYRIELARDDGKPYYDGCDYVNTLAELKYYKKCQLPEGCHIVSITRCYKDGAGEVIYKMEESIYDFDAQNRPMYQFAKKKHDDTGAIRKHSGDPYWVHPEGVAKIASAYGGSDIEIQAAMAHDTLEDTACSYEELEEMFGDEVASIVREITNDSEEVDRLGKEQYINLELVSLSHPALFVKLCDMYYNQMDYPKEGQKQRMIKNINYLLVNREDDLNERETALIEDILQTLL